MISELRDAGSGSGSGLWYVCFPIITSPPSALVSSTQPVSPSVTIETTKAKVPKILAAKKGVHFHFVTAFNILIAFQ
jgi:hypothetical protein